MTTSVLIIRLSALGDVINSLPVAHAIKSLPGAPRITWLVEPLAYPLLKGNPAIDEVIVFPGKSSWMNMNFGQAIGRVPGELLNFITELRKRHFDVSIDAQGLLKSALLGWLSAAPVRIGFAGTREFADCFLTHKVNVGDYFGNSHHIVELNLKLVERLAEVLRVPPSSIFSQVKFPLPTPSPETEQTIEKWARARPIGSSKLVVLIPGTTWSSKIWPATHWADLAKLILNYLNDSQTNVWIIGGAQDKEMAVTIIQNMPDSMRAMVSDFTGKTSLLELIEIFRRAKLVIGADTGPLHLAQAAGVSKVIGIYGSTPVIRNGPYGSNCLAITAQLSCQPCFQKTCPLGTRACLIEMAPDFVFRRLVDFITQS